MALSVTFDSNVWRKVASPHRFTKDPDHQIYVRLHRRITCGRISARVAETIFNLEALPGSARAQFFASYRPRLETRIVETRADGSVHARTSISPGASNHPGNTGHLATHFADATAAGFRVLSCPRIGAVRSASLTRGVFHHETSRALTARLDRYHEALRDIESRGCGIVQLKSLATRFEPANVPWLQRLKSASPDDEPAIRKGVAEWADADAIAAHIGYRLDYFCTLDKGVSAGSSSVLAPGNRQYLERVYAVRFVTPAELNAIAIARSFLPFVGLCGTVLVLAAAGIKGAASTVSGGQSSSAP